MADQRPESLLWSIIVGRWTAQALQAAARLDVAAHLGGGPKSSAELAAATGATPDKLYRLLRALASVGVFAQVGDDDLWQQTPASALLRRDAPGGLAACVMLDHEPRFYEAWGHFAESLKADGTAFEHAAGSPLFSHLSGDRALADTFDRAMTANSRADVAALLAAYDFSAARHLVDVGGGQGALVEALLGAYPALRATLFDLAPVAARAAPGAWPGGLGGRCEVRAGDALADPLPPADCYVAKYVVHVLDDRAARALFANVRRSIEPGGRLLLAEQVVAPGNVRSPAKWLDLVMMALTGGRTRTEREFAELLRAEGFHLRAALRTPGPLCIIEACPA